MPATVSHVDFELQLDFPVPQVTGCFGVGRRIYLLGELKDFTEKLERAAKLNSEIVYDPDLNDGVVLTFVPLYHPWQKPLAEIECLLCYFTKPGDLAIDPCGGFTSAVSWTVTFLRLVVSWLRWLTRTSAFPGQHVSSTCTAPALSRTLRSGRGRLQSCCSNKATLVVKPCR